MMTVQQQLRGTGVALVTPFAKDGSVDYNALGKVIDHVIKGGVEYLITLGTTGETPTLSKEEKIAVIEFTFSHTAGRLPIIVGVGGNNTAEVISDLQKLPLYKALAILSAAPYYNKPSQEGIYQHYKAVAAASPKPIILYNVPGRTGRNMSAATTIRLANDCPNVVALKEASGDMAQCMDILRDAPANFVVVSGDDLLALPQIACGMEGVISVAANAYPAEFSNMVRACLAGDFVKAKAMNDPLIEGYDIMFAENNPSGVKAFMHEMGLLENEVRLPVVPLSEPVYSRVKTYLAK
jgi:4-hydroxy-tetrahydrodipicolinate synthase